MLQPHVPRRVVIAAVLVGLVGVALVGYTAITTVALIAHPDPMLGLEMIVSAVFLLGAGGAVAVSLGLMRGASWARPGAIGAALLLILIAIALPLMSPRGASVGAPPIDASAWLVAAVGLLLLTFIAKPYR